VPGLDELDSGSSGGHSSEVQRQQPPTGRRLTAMLPGLRDAERSPVAASSAEQLTGSRHHQRIRELPKRRAGPPATCRARIGAFCDHARCRPGRTLECRRTAGGRRYCRHWHRGEDVRAPGGPIRSRSPKTHLGRVCYVHDQDQRSPLGAYEPPAFSGWEVSVLARRATPSARRSLRS
jgi:hypothetical protein